MLLFPAIPFIPVEAGIQTTYWIKISKDREYGLIEEEFSITVQSNATQTFLEVYDPNLSLIYNLSRGGNYTQKFTPSSNFAFGTYTFVAGVGNVKTKIWYTLWDAAGWQPIYSWPYQVEHNNFVYLFQPDFSLNVSQGDDGLSLDFGFLRSLALDYGLDWQAYQNSMGFAIRFSKNDVKVDLAFAFIYCGAKIVVNGTIPNPRTLEFQVSAKKLQSWIKGARSGNIVFDFNDIKDVFDYMNGTLSVHVPSKFHVDPTIFSNGFEEGDFSAWTGISLTPEITETNPHHGIYNAYFNLHNEYAYKSINEPSVFVRCYVRFESLPSTNGHRMEILHLQPSTDTGLNIEIFNNGGTITWRSYMYTGSWEAITSVTPAIEIDVDYCVEIRRTANTIGGGQFWINNELKGTCTGTIPNTNTITVFCGTRIDGTPSAEFIDCVVISDEYIGPEAGNINAPTIGCFLASNPTSLESNTTISCRLQDLDGKANIQYCNLTLEADSRQPIILSWQESDNSTSLSDPHNLAALMDDSTTELNSTSYQVSWIVYFYGNFTYSWVHLYNATVVDDEYNSTSTSQDYLFFVESNVSDTSLSSLGFVLALCSLGLAIVALLNKG